MSDGLFVKTVPLHPIAYDIVYNLMHNTTDETFIPLHHSTVTYIGNSAATREKDKHMCCVKPFWGQVQSRAFRTEPQFARDGIFVVVVGRWAGCGIVIG